jgi:peptidoglycan/LPS O-acetylase OafA/YrhL
MLLPKPYNKNKEDNKKRRDPLNYIAVMKFWAMIIIIRWHVYQWKQPRKYRIYYGARMCEFLFISSGFLVGYNYYKRPMPATYYASFKYAYKHLRNFYPLHILNSIYLIYIRVYIDKRKFTLTDYEMLIFNFLLVKVWSNDPKFGIGFNGISWFINVQLYLYFLSPFLLVGIQNVKNSLIIFGLVTFTRLGIEILIRKGALNFLDFNFHYGPVIRLLEFYLGMLMIPLFDKIKFLLDKIKNSIFMKYFFTIIQSIIPIIIYYIMLKYNYLYRCYFVLIFCPFTFLISLDYGYLSNINNNKICKKIMSCQMEMYLLQSQLNNTLRLILKNHWPNNRELTFSIKVGFIFLISYIYKKLFRDKFAIFMDKIIDILQKIFI